MTTLTTIEPGVYTDLPFDDYMAIDAASSTYFKALERSPAYFHWLRSNPPEPDTGARLIGSAVHCGVLTPDLFHDQYELFVGDKRTKEAKERFQAILDAGKTPLREKAYEQVMDIIASLAEFELFQKLARKATHREATMVWEESVKGSPVLCKGRIDMGGAGWMVDLKTTNDLGSFSPWHITRRRYYRQAAWYLRGAKALGLEMDRFFWVAVQSDAPYEADVFDMDAAAQAAGDHECQDLLADYAACMDAGEWPRHGDKRRSGEITDARFREIFPDES